MIGCFRWFVVFLMLGMEVVADRVEYPTKAGEYTCKGWKYVYEIQYPGTRSETRIGRLFLGGKEVKGFIGELNQEPIGLFLYFGEGGYNQGWLNTLTYDHKVFAEDGGPTEQARQLLQSCREHAASKVPKVPKSLSPDGKLHAVMDIDRDPAISPRWKEDSFPQIEITDKGSGRVLASVGYFGSPGDDARPLREHVRVNWRPDSKAFAITIDDRFYSSCMVFVLNSESKFVEVALPGYQEMTGYPAPDVRQLRARGRSGVSGWDAEGRLKYGIWLSPLPTYQGDDPLRHEVLMDVSPEGMVVVREKDDGQTD